ncbi:MAG: amidohydrolase family protein [Candidatus Binatia bacterium]
MAKNGFKVMDSDMHVMEPPDLWQRYIDPQFADRAPIGLTRDFRDLGIQVEGKVLPIPRQSENPALANYRRVTLMEKYSDVAARNFDGGSQLMAMDKEGLDVALLYPTRGLFVLAIDGLDPDLAAAIARAYNDWLQDFRQVSPDRMYGVAMVAPHNIPAAVEEIRRTVEQYGFKGIFLRPNHVNGRKWSDPYYDPLWAECERLDIPVGFHEAGRVYLPQPAIHQLIPTFSMFNTLSFPLANMFTCADMIFGGVFERFPRLKAAFLEGNCSWLPWLLWRMGEYTETVGKAEYPDLKLTPIEYFQRQCYGAVECDEITARYMPDFGLENNIVFSTDYPHLDVKYPHAVDSFLQLPFPEKTKRKYLWDNCARLYNL